MACTEIRTIAGLAKIGDVLVHRANRGAIVRIVPAGTRRVKIVTIVGAPIFMNRGEWIMVLR